MLTIPNIAIISDLVQLPKAMLQDICTNLNLPDDGSVAELSDKIWRRIEDSYTIQDQALEPCKQKILCGRTSVTWYHLDSGGDLSGTKELIINNLRFNPFKRIEIPIAENLQSQPVLISGSLINESEYYLRFIYKSGMARHFYGNHMIMNPKSSTVTVYINENTGCIEVRSDPTTAKKVASSLAQLISQEISMAQTDIIAPFGHDVARMADALGGELIDASAKPELILEDFSQEQADAVVSILSVLDTYLVEDDAEKLREELSDAKSAFSEELLLVPFTALILNGLEKVGMGVSGRDLRGLPLYDYLQPYLQHQGGFIQFRHNEDGVTSDYTIRVGLKSNSIYFVTSATENVIRYVRERVLL